MFKAAFAAVATDYFVPTGISIGLVLTDTGFSSIPGGGTVTTANGVVAIHIYKSGATLDTADYVLFNLTGPAASVTGSFNSNPGWLGTIPANAAHYSILTAGNTVVLHYTP